jgi:hypothetical protein
LRRRAPLLAPFEGERCRAQRGGEGVSRGVGDEGVLSTLPILNVAPPTRRFASTRPQGRGRSPAKTPPPPLARHPGDPAPRRIRRPSPHHRGRPRHRRGTAPPAPEQVAAPADRTDLSQARPRRAVQAGQRQPRRPYPPPFTGEGDHAQHGGGGVVRGRSRPTPHPRLLPLRPAALSGSAAPRTCPPHAAPRIMFVPGIVEAAPASAAAILRRPHQRHAPDPAPRSPCRGA